MQFTTVFTLIAGASLAMAAAIPEANAPTYGGSEPSSGPTCSNQQQQACCKGNDSNGSGLLGDVLGGILGGNCELSILDATCSGGQIACCPTDGQTGLINVGSICAPIQL